MTRKIIIVLIVMAVLFIGGCIESEKTYYLSVACEECWGCGCNVDVYGGTRQLPSGDWELIDRERIADTNYAITEKCLYDRYPDNDVTELEISKTELNEIKDCIERLEEEKYCQSYGDCCIDLKIAQRYKKCPNYCLDNRCVSGAQKSFTGVFNCCEGFTKLCPNSYINTTEGRIYLPELTGNCEEKEDYINKTIEVSGSVVPIYCPPDPVAQCLFGDQMKNITFEVVDD